MWGFMDLKEERQLHYEQSYQKVINTGRLLSSMSAWNSENLVSGMVRMGISGPNITTLEHILKRNFIYYVHCAIIHNSQKLETT
jgi:hypothetical protein